jgi:hypothetical protein
MVYYSARQLPNCFPCTTYHVCASLRLPCKNIMQTYTDRVIQRYIFMCVIIVVPCTVLCIYSYLYIVRVYKCIKYCDVYRFKRLRAMTKRMSVRILTYLYIKIYNNNCNSASVRNGRRYYVYKDFLTDDFIILVYNHISIQRRGC